MPKEKHAKCQILYLRVHKLIWERRVSLQKRFVNVAKRFGKATGMLLFLSVLMLAIIMPVTKAQAQSISVYPTSGTAGEGVEVGVHGFPGDTLVTLTFGTASWGSPMTDYGGNIDDYVNVPSVSAGAYTVTATCPGGSATTTFTVIGSSATATPLSTPVGSTGTSTGTTTGLSPTGLSPANTPLTVTSSNGFWSPLAIAVTSAVIAFAVFITAIFVMRGRQKPLSYREDLRNEPRPSTPSKTPYTSTPSKTPYTPSSRSSQPASTDLSADN